MCVCVYVRRLDYPGIGPEHSFLMDAKRAEYYAVTDQEALDVSTHASTYTHTHSHTPAGARPQPPPSYHTHVRARASTRAGARAHIQFTMRRPMLM